MLTPFLPDLTSPTVTPSSILRPCLSKAFFASLAICSSTAPRKVGRASRTATSEPRRRHTADAQGAVVREDVRFVERRARQGARVRAGGDDDVLADDAFFSRASHLD